MKKKWIIWGVSIGVVLLLALPKLSGILFTSSSSMGAVIGSDKTNITATIASMSLSKKEIKLIGTVLANEESILTTKTSGTIKAIYFTEGQSVKKGDILLELTNDDIKANLEKAKATLFLQQKNEERQRALFEKKIISEADYDNAKTLFATAKADALYIEEQINNTRIIAPYNGIVGLRSVSVGSYINSSSKITLLQDVSKLKIDFGVPEQYISFIEKTKSIIIGVNDQKETMAEATIYAIENKVDETTRTVNVRAVTKNSNKLFPGQSVGVFIPLSQKDSVIKLPTISIVPVLKGQEVWVVKNGRTQSVPVDVGMREDDNIEITNGIKAGDTIVVDGVIRVRKGTKINITSLK